MQSDKEHLDAARACPVCGQPSVWPDGLCDPCWEDKIHRRWCETVEQAKKAADAGQAGSGRPKEAA
jgi:hypothetical protein